MKPYESDSPLPDGELDTSLLHEERFESAGGFKQDKAWLLHYLLLACCIQRPGVGKGMTTAEQASASTISISASIVLLTQSACVP